jgi:hypothetical protein
MLYLSCRKQLQEATAGSNCRKQLQEATAGSNCRKQLQLRYNIGFQTSFSVQEATRHHTIAEAEPPCLQARRQSHDLPHVPALTGSVTHSYREHTTPHLLSLLLAFSHPQEALSGTLPLSASPTSGPGFRSRHSPAAAGVSVSPHSADTKFICPLHDSRPDYVDAQVRGQTGGRNTARVWGKLPSRGLLL